MSKQLPGHLRTYVLYYDGIGLFEGVIAIGNLAMGGDVQAAALEHRPYETMEKLKVMPDCVLSEVDPAKVDILIIPGGRIETVIHNPELLTFLEKLHRNGKTIAAASSGILLLARAGLLKNTSFSRGMEYTQQTKPLMDEYFGGLRALDEDVVVDGAIITAKSFAFIEFGVETAWQMGVYQSEEDAERDYLLLKNIKPAAEE